MKLAPLFCALFLFAGDDNRGAPLRLFSAYGFASGCPISEYQIMTARHIAHVHPSTGEILNAYVIWSDSENHTGNASLEDFDVRRDLALLHSETRLPHVYRPATTAPQLGEDVWIGGFNFDDALKPKIVKTQVVNIISAHLILKASGEPGFSGSCVLNAANEVVGIFHWTMRRGDSRPWGIASAVYGEWRDISWTPEKDKP